MSKSSKAVCRTALLLILIIPFILRERSKTLEVYPAVLLPAGDGVISTTDGVVTFRSLELAAIHNNGTEEILEPEAFFGDIPVHYWPPIARREFGLKAEERRSLTIGAWTVSAVVSPQATVQEQQQLQEWVSQRLKAMNLSQVSAIRVRSLKVLFDVETGTEIKRMENSYFDVEINQ